MIRFEKNPWGIKQQMKGLWDYEGRKLNGDEKKVQVLVKRNFIINRKWETENCERRTNNTGKAERESEEWKEYRGEAEAALRSTKNTSALSQPSSPIPLPYNPCHSHPCHVTHLLASFLYE